MLEELMNFKRNWKILEVRDSLGFLLAVTRDGQYRENYRQSDEESGIFYWYLDGELVLSFIEGGAVLLNRLGGRDVSS